MENVILVIQEGEKLEDPGKNSQSNERTKKISSGVWPWGANEPCAVHWWEAGSLITAICATYSVSDAMNLGASHVFFLLPCLIQVMVDC